MNYLEFICFFLWSFIELLRYLSENAAKMRANSDKISDILTPQGSFQII